MNETTTEISEETHAFEQLNILLESIEQHPDAAVRDHVRALVYTLLDLHRGALRRVVEIVSAQPDGEKTLRDLSDDDLVRAVLMVHELMPETLETRVEIALAEAREQLAIYGADVELVGIRNGVARLKLIGGAQTASVSTALLKSEIEQAVHNVAPDLLNIEYEDFIASAAARPANLVQIKPRPVVQNISPGTILIPIIRAVEIPDDGFRVVESGDINLLLCKMTDVIYVFQNRCAKDSSPLGESFLKDGILTCACHGLAFNVRKKGQCATEPDLRLEALPSKVENGVVKVALPQEENETNATTF